MPRQRRRRRLALSLLFLLLLFFFTFFPTLHRNLGDDITRQTTPKPPHIIFIVADDLGWNDVGWHNPQMYTPNLDKLAMNGVRLNSSYVQPMCTPSRNCFMTGLYPYHTGLQHGVIRRKSPGYMPSNLPTLAEELKRLGYATHMVGKWHLGYCNWKYTPTYRGFDSFMGFYNGCEDYYTRMIDDGYDFRWNKSVHHPPENMYSTEVIANHAIDIINTIDPNTQPLYLYLPFQSVHYPQQVPKKYENIYKHIKTTERRIYCGMVSALDEAVGKVTAALKARGFMNNALLVFTTDNGGKPKSGGNNLPLRGGKATLWEGGTRGVAFVYSEKLLTKTKYTNTGMIHAVDWFPTLLTLAGGQPSIFIDGLDQWRALSEGVTSPRTEFVYNIDELANNSAIRVGKYKLIQGSSGRRNGWTPLPGIQSTTQYRATTKRSRKKLPPYQLFDIEEDPTEHYDLSGKLPDVLAKMKQRLAFFKESLVRANFPAPDPKSDPKNFGGIWSPGWC